MPEDYYETFRARHFYAPLLNGRNQHIGKGKKICILFIFAIN